MTVIRIAEFMKCIKKRNKNKKTKAGHSLKLYRQVTIYTYKKYNNTYII